MSVEVLLRDDVRQRLEEFNRCRIISLIGNGATGAVYKAHHQDLDLEVAVKVLHASHGDSSDAAARFLREARIAARLNHPGIVRVFDCGEFENCHYLIMEYVDGRSLEQEIQQQGRLPVERAVEIAQAVAEALREAYDQDGVIHRDIKPANILLTSSGQVKLADLGLAKAVSLDPESTAQTITGSTLGTPRYMSPEQFADASQVDHRADIFSLGATLYHMLSGTVPFAGETFIQVYNSVEASTPAPLPASVPQAVEDLVFRMIEKNPEARPDTYATLIEAFQQLRGSPGDTQTGPSASTPNHDPLASTYVPAARTTGRSARSAAPAENRVLLVVDVQNDFCPGGALAVPDGDAVVPVINKLSRRFGHVILTQDWHCEDHLSFASSHPGKKTHQQIELPYGPQILWPDHCVQQTQGAEFHPQLAIPHCELIIRKGYHREIDSYSAFFENDRQTPTGLAGYLRERGLMQLFIVGLATDFCVAYSALDARRLGFEVTVIEEGCRGIDLDGSVAAAWKQLETEGVTRV